MKKHSDHSHLRLDIQGLRALAVTLVVLDHAFGFPTGGFVGVDVFYVISGFLITSHLLREIETTGSLSIMAFYSRRVRRILPVALFVALVTVILAFILWFPQRASQVLIDALSAIGFVANFHFMALGTDYLQQDAAISPFQHYWSLSIEEQFYAIWPLVLFALTFFFRDMRFRVAVVSVIAASSLAWGIYRSSTIPAMAYFDTGVRAWELLFGAILAMSGNTANSRRLPQRVRQWGSLFGVALIIVSAFLVNSSWTTPVPAVLPAVLGAVIVIGMDAPLGSQTLLGNPVSQWLGGMSYSLYLWHFPVLIFASAEFGPSWIVGLSMIPVMLILSWFSYLFVERAVLESRFLKPDHAGAKRKWRLSFELALGASMLGVIVVFSLAQLYGPSLVRSAAPWLKHFNHSSPLMAVEITPSEEQKATEIAEALKATQWPQEIKAQLSQLSEADFADAMFLCRQSPLSKEPHRICRYTYGDVPVAVIGDSIAASWVPAIDAIARVQGWDLTAIAYSNCSLVDVDVTNGTSTPGFLDACKQRRAEMFELLTELKPKIVFLSGSESALTYTGLNLEAATSEWKAGLERTFSRLAAIGQVIVLENPPWGGNPAECATRFSSPESCVSKVSQRHKLKSTAEASTADKFGNVIYVPTRSWFCFEDECPVFSSGLVTRVDKAHLTSAAAVSLSRLILQYAAVEN